jgi:hypothetical protein
MTCGIETKVFQFIVFSTSVIRNCKKNINKQVQHKSLAIFIVSVRNSYTITSYHETKCYTTDELWWFIIDRRPTMQPEINKQKNEDKGHQKNIPHPLFY